MVLGSTSFPITKRSVDSYIYQYLLIENKDIIEKYELEPFEMAVQSLERTFIDKVFAVCDYYLEGRINKHSRHIYDLYKIFPTIVFNDEFKDLIIKVRNDRQKLSICPSAKPNVDINKLLNEIKETKIYYSDYVDITEYFIYEPVKYEEIIKVLDEIIKLNIF